MCESESVCGCVGVCVGVSVCVCVSVCECVCVGVCVPKLGHASTISTTTCMYMCIFTDP